MKLLDLFCCAGGIARGFTEAGWEVEGVDIAPQPRYPYAMRVADALAVDLNGYDGVHASPPCQFASNMSKAWNGRPEDHPDLIGPIRERLLEWGGPYIIENVVGARAKLRDPLMLCGTMFPGLRVLRHRLFESNVDLGPAPPHGEHPLVYTRDRRKAHYGQLDERTAFVSVNGGGNCSVAAARDAMGIDWPMTKAEVNEPIPPAYGKWLGERFAAGIESGLRRELPLGAAA